MTISSLGSIGGSFFTPIINQPEVAILGVGKAEKNKYLWIRINMKVELCFHYHYLTIIE